MFSPPIILTWSYNPDTLPANVTEESLILAYYDGNEWIGLVCTVDTENDVITASVSHFTTFAIIGSVLPPPVLAPVPAPAPAPSPAPPSEITVTFPHVSDYCTIDVDYPSGREGNLPIPEGFVTVRKGGAVTFY